MAYLSLHTLMLRPFLCVVLAGLDIIELLSSRRRQIHSVAVLAHASADVATPLLLSATLKVGLDCLHEHLSCTSSACVMSCIWYMLILRIYISPVSDLSASGYVFHVACIGMPNMLCCM